MYKPQPSSKRPVTAAERINIYRQLKGKQLDHNSIIKQNLRKVNEYNSAVQSAHELNNDLVVKD